MFAGRDKPLRARAEGRPRLGFPSSRGWGPGALLGAALALQACGGVPYSIRVLQASNALTRAEQLGAAARAPYEYHYALEHLRKAREQAGRSQYGNAAELADTAYDYATRAVQVAQRVEPVAPIPQGQQ